MPCVLTAEARKCSSGAHCFDTFPPLSRHHVRSSGILATKSISQATRYEEISPSPVWEFDLSSVPFADIELSMANELIERAKEEGYLTSPVLAEDSMQSSVGSIKPKRGRKKKVDLQANRYADCHFSWSGLILRFWLSTQPATSTENEGRALLYTEWWRRERNQSKT